MTGWPPDARPPGHSHVKNRFHGRSARAITTSLLVDGRPIHGDPGLPAVTEVFQEVRRHPGTMRLLMQESLSMRARYRSVRDIFTRRETFDIKTHALLPIVNIARGVGRGIRRIADHRTASNDCGCGINSSSTNGRKSRLAC